MFTMIVAAAMAAAPTPVARNADAQAPKTQMGQMPGMDMSKMDHSKMSDGCCKKNAAGKMECAMPNKAGAASGHQGHSGQ